MAVMAQAVVTAVPGSVRVLTGPRVLAAVTACGLVAGLALEASAGLDRIVNPFLPVIVIGSVLGGVLGVLVARRHPGHRVALVLQGIGLTGALMVLSGGYANAALFGPLPDTGAAWALWVSRWVWVPQLFLQTTALMLAFPDGRLPSIRWRPAAWAAVAGGLAFTLLVMTDPFSESVWRDVPVTNPVGVATDGGLAMVLGVGAPLAMVAGTGVAAAAVVVRHRRATGVERDRLGLVVVPAVLVPPALFLSLFVGDVGGIAEMLVVTGLAVTITWSMLRHGILDLDVVLNRAAVYGLAAASLLGLYVTVVVLAAQALGSRSSWVPGVVGAGVVAAFVGPLLHHLRRGVDRLLFGQRGDPDAVLGRLVVAADPSAPGALQVIAPAAEALRTALRVPWVRVTVGDHTAQAGQDRTGGHDVDLRYSGELVGRLWVGERYDGERVSAAQDRVLRAVASQLAGTAHAVLLAERLAVSRERLVLAREDERRRVRHDLHDGLGPALAGLTLALEGAEEIASRDAGAAAGLLPEMRRQCESAVADVHRLVEGMRPPALDTVGLVGALRQELSSMTGPHGPRIALEAGALPPLAAATEVAALRIALEAVHNVVKHAHASTCVVALSTAGDRLGVDVSDDGVGLPDGVLPHVGLDSMRERAEELGGSVEVRASATGGTTVSARLPLAPL